MNSNVRCLSIIIYFLSSFIMAESNLVPDEFKVTPNGPIEVSYPSGVKVDAGNELTPTQVKDEPNVKWEADHNTLYTLVMTDVDVPKPNGEILHWLIGNILGNDISKGEVLAKYRGSGPPLGSGAHRYMFLVYKQNGKIDFGPKIVGTSRRAFSFKAFAEKYNLQVLVAANYYKAQYDDYVPILRNTPDN